MLQTSAQSTCEKIADMHGPGESRVFLANRPQPASPRPGDEREADPRPAEPGVPSPRPAEREPGPRPPRPVPPGPTLPAASATSNWPRFLGDCRAIIAADPREAARLIQDAIRDLDKELRRLAIQTRRINPSPATRQAWDAR